jgi:hypothetical protein
MLLSASAVAVACVDLFHSTDFGSCGASCGDASLADVVGGHDVRDAPRDTGHRADATMSDAHFEAAADGGAPGDGAGPGESGGHDAAHDAGHDVDRSVDADFCSWSTSEARTKAAHACLWLGACLGTMETNDFGKCYADALLAYDCQLNPQLQVSGPLHAYWNALFQAASCNDVKAAVFPEGVPMCTNPAATCANQLEGGTAYGNVAVECADGGGFLSAASCAAEGLTCSAGHCVVPGDASCSAGCVGNVAHVCGGLDGAVSGSDDLGRDCSHVGAGQCSVGSQVAGCKPAPVEAGMCNRAAATCSGMNALTTSCAGDFFVTFNCQDFPGDSGCTGMAPNPDPTRLCTGWEATGPAAHCADAAVAELAGPAGFVVAGCRDAGLSGCATIGPRCAP